jgi:predicted regulator of Ras-like GTPase activity (Roadblock/LC7/MglB family)
MVSIPSDCSEIISHGSASLCCAAERKRSSGEWKQRSYEAQPMSGSSSWSFREEDAKRIQTILSGFLGESNARTALIVDRTGQMVATVGEAPAFDPTAFASLTAADFSANDQLARMLGESEFGALFHQGERESMYLADIARRVILVVLFDNRTTLGLVKLRVKAAVTQLTQVFTEMFNRDGTNAPGVESEFLGEAEDEIDKLFGA